VWNTGPGLATPTQMHSPAGRAADGCNYCEKRDTRERELRAEEEDCAEERQVKELVCRGLQTVDVAELRQQQEQDVDLQPVLQ